jgi:hypothetical protein
MPWRVNIQGKDELGPLAKTRPPQVRSELRLRTARAAERKGATSGKQSPSSVSTC